MKKQTIFICFLLLTATGYIFPQNINGRVSSSVYSFERYDTVNVNNYYLRFFEQIGLNFNQDNFSLRTNIDYEGSSSSNLTTPYYVRFYNLYIEQRNLFDVMTLRLGRQPIFNAVGGGVYDGVNVDLDYTDYKISAYYGGNTPTYQTLKFNNDWNDNFISGGKFTLNSIENFQVALSYVNKNFKPDDYYATRLDANLNPIQLLIQHNSEQYSYGSAEVNYTMKNLLDINASYDYDFNYSMTSKVEINAEYTHLDNFKLNLYYNYRQPRITYNSIFSVFNYGNTQEMELGGDYIVNKHITITGRVADVIYNDANSQRITVGINSTLGSLTYLKNLGYAGEMDALSFYAAHSFLTGLLTPSIGVSYTSYKLSKDDNTNYITSFLAGVNVRPYRTLSFELQGQYMDNKIYRNDFRYFLKLNYWFNTNFM
jgi:hypothetical protein